MTDKRFLTGFFRFIAVLAGLGRLKLFAQIGCDVPVARAPQREERILLHFRR